MKTFFFIYLFIYLFLFLRFRNEKVLKKIECWEIFLFLGALLYSTGPYVIPGNKEVKVVLFVG